MSSRTKKILIISLVSFLVVAGITVALIFSLLNNKGEDDPVDTTPVVGETDGDETEDEPKSEFIMVDSVIPFDNAKVKEIENSIIDISYASNGVSALASPTSPLNELRPGDIIFLESDKDSAFGESYFGKVAAKIKLDEGYVFRFVTPKMDEVFSEIDVDFTASLDYENISEIQAVEGVEVTPLTDETAYFINDDGLYVSLTADKMFEGKIENGGVSLNINIDLKKYLNDIIGSSSDAPNSDSISIEDAKKIEVFYTDTGRCYHRDTCHCLMQSKYSIMLYDAISVKNLRDCLICKPPVTELFSNDMYKEKTSLKLTGFAKLSNLKVSVNSENGKTWTEEDGFDNLQIALNGNFSSQIKLAGDFDASFGAGDTVYKYKDWIAINGLQEKTFPLVYIKYNLPGNVSLKYGRDAYATKGVSVGVLFYSDLSGNLSASAEFTVNYNKDISKTMDIFKDKQFLGVGEETKHEESESENGLSWSVSAEMAGDIDFKLLGCSAVLFVGNVNILEVNIASFEINANGNVGVNASNSGNKIEVDGGIGVYLNLFSLAFRLKVEAKYLLNEDWQKYAGPLVRVCLINKSGTYDRLQAPDGSTVYEAHAYQMFDESMSWSEAKAYCESLGGHLVTINSQTEQDFLIEFVKNSTKWNMWLGAYLDEETNEYKWVTGEDFSYTNWNLADNEPNNVFGIQASAMMYTQNSTNPVGTWNDENENGRNWAGYELTDFGFICEWESK